jgi:hypothetical protein
MASAAAATLLLVDALLRLPVSGPTNVAAATGAELAATREHPTWVRYEGRCTSGPFRTVEVRADRYGPESLVILREPSSRLSREDLDLARYGPARSMAIEPHATSWSAAYDQEGLALTFCFLIKTDELVSVTIERR